MRAATARASSAICLHKVAEYDAAMPRFRDGTSRKRNHDHRIHRGVTATELAPSAARAPWRGCNRACQGRSLSCAKAFRRASSSAIRRVAAAVARLSVCSAHVRVTAADHPMRLLGDAWSKKMAVPCDTAKFREETSKKADSATRGRIAAVHNVGGRSFACK
jgi:hypothetical protein